MTTKRNIDAARIRETAEAIGKEPSLANVSFSVHSDWAGGLRASSVTGDMSQAGEVQVGATKSYPLESDEPPALLGEDSAPSAGDYVLKALAACYAVTFAANAAVREIELESLHFDLEGSFDLRGFLGLDESVRPGMRELRVVVSAESPNATREQLEQLVETVQERSPIRDTLVSPVPVITSLADDRPEASTTREPPRT